MEKLVIDPLFWKGKKVFLTGHTGFKGSWLALWLHSLGAEVTGYSLSPPTVPAIFDVTDVKSSLKRDIRGDICNRSDVNAAMHEAEPDIVIHMAAQSLVRESYIDPVGTYDTNVMGTINILEAVRNTPSVKAVLNITTDKCYENQEWVWGYRENEPMGGHDPYSNSKACSELISSSYRQSFLREADIALATARAGNVIGGGDWAKDRIVPDAMRAFMEEKPLLVRNPMATRPWQHVLEPLLAYLMLCQKLVEEPQQFDQGWNIGPDDVDAQPVSVLANIMVEKWGEGAHWELDKDAHPHEARDLKLDCSKAKVKLNWNPIWGLAQALDETVKWYKAWHNGEDMPLFTKSQIEAFQQSFLVK